MIKRRRGKKEKKILLQRFPVRVCVFFSRYGPTCLRACVYVKLPRRRLVDKTSLNASLKPSSTRVGVKERKTIFGQFPTHTDTINVYAYAQVYLLLLLL